MTRNELIHQIKVKRSFLCVGLDTDIQKIPAHLLDHEDPVFEFNRQIIEATADLCVAYKPNMAFYESRGAAGWESLRKTWDILPKDCFSIADAKRGDIGNTSELYSQTFCDQQHFGLGLDVIPVSLFMCHDSVQPFLQFQRNWTVVLALNSNTGGVDYHLIAAAGGVPLFERVIPITNTWG